jgi:hypothetical protein
MFDHRNNNRQMDIIDFNSCFGLWLCMGGHFFFEKNKPATFVYPLYSLGSDFVMFWHILTGQIGKKIREAEGKII